MQSLRQTVEAFERAGHLRRIARTIDPVYEVAAVLERLDRTAAGLFEHVKGHDLPLAGNLFHSRARLAEGLGVPETELRPALSRAITSGIPPLWVDHGACQEVEIPHPDLAAALPVPTFFERETGPYLTAGVIVARHPDTGRRNLSIARAKLVGGDRLLMGIAPPHHLARLVEESLARGRPLPIAITLGNAAAVLLASNFYLDYGHDEFEIAGALLGRGVQVVRGRDVDLPVPADCEIVLEGTIGGERLDEGPVSEFHGMYERYGTGAVATISRLTRRHDALLQVILPGYHAEHMLIGAEAIASTTFHHVQRAVPCVHDVHVPLSSGGRLQAVIALADPAPGDAWRAMEAAWAHCRLLKHLVVVDEDVDIRDARAVNYALATRWRGEPDLRLLPAALTDRSEPLEGGGTVTKVGLVALRRPHGSRSEFEAAHVPEAVRRAVEADWPHYFTR